MCYFFFKKSKLLDKTLFFIELAHTSLQCMFGGGALEAKIAV